jgi:hypothetical protein
MAKGVSLARRQAETYTPSVVKELAALEQDLGGRPALLGLLALAPLNKDLRYVLGLLGDPQHDRLTLATICAKGNLLPGDLLKYLGAAALHRGQTLAKQRIGEAIPRVVADVMRKAAPYEEACYHCLGTGSITPDPSAEQPNPSPGPCPTCQGSGTLVYQPDLETQKLAIDMGGLTQKSGGISILNQNLNLPQAGGAGGGALEQLQTLTDAILYGEEDPVVDAEVTPVPPPTDLP